MRTREKNKRNDSDSEISQKSNSTLNQHPKDTKKSSGVEMLNARKSTIPTLPSIHTARRTMIAWCHKAPSRITSTMQVLLKTKVDRRNNPIPRDNLKGIALRQKTNSSTF